LKILEDSNNSLLIDYEKPYVCENDLENHGKRIELDLCICLALVNYEWNEW